MYSLTNKCLFLFMIFSVISLFSCSSKQYLEPWMDNYAKSFDDPRMVLAAHGILAPNSHNMQPWKIKLSGENEFLLYVDKDKLTLSIDPDSRQIFISHGTFLSFVMNAGKNLGYKTTISIL